VNSYTYEVQTVSQITRWLVDTLQPTAVELGCWAYLERLPTMVENPDCAARQRDIFHRTRDRAAIVRELTAASRVSPCPTPGG
jgi:hypothetical protein